MNEEKKSNKGLYIAIAVVVGLLGVCGVGGCLVAIGVPAFQGYMRRATTSEADTNMHHMRTMEARMNLRQLRVMAESYYQEQSVYPPLARPTPATPMATQQSATWDAPGFQAIGFNPGVPVYYSYSIQRSGDNAIELVAEGDLDGDGTRSRFSIRCVLYEGCDPDPTILNELE